jgi:prepilin-type processing-associated H-X9-DG protein
MKFWALMLLTAAGFAQPREIGANLGYGVYRDGAIYGWGATAEAGIRNRFAAGIDLGYQFSEYVSGQFNYLYQDGHPFLEAPGVYTEIQGQSQALMLRLLFHFKPRERRWRPFVAGGAGAKGYIIAGPEPYPQLIPQIATLTDNDVWKVAFEAGGGMECLARRHVLVRAEFRDYLTTFPRQEIVPAPHNTARGIFQQFTPLVSASYAF